MIEFKDISYYYKINKKEKGFLSRKKERLLALNKINFEINSSDREAIIGFNGAGKSTLIKLIIGILKPAGGTIRVDGLDPWKNREKHVKNIGVVWGQRSTLWWELPVIESFSALRKIYNVSEIDFKNRIEDLDNILDISSFWDQPVRKLSLGQKTKAEIVAALIHNPNTLILDEPFLGLDFISRRTIVDLLNNIIEKDKKTLVLTSHNLEDINELCSNITLLEKGSITFKGRIDEVVNQANKFTEIIVEKNDFFPLSLKSAEKKGIVIEQASNRNKFKISFLKDEVNIKDVITEVFQENKGVIDIKIQEESLEKAFSKLINRNKREEGDLYVK